MRPLLAPHTHSLDFLWGTATTLCQSTAASTWFLGAGIVPSTCSVRSVQHVVPTARTAVLKMMNSHESAAKRLRCTHSAGHLAAVDAGARAEAAAETRSAEEWEAIANARIARKAQHRARGAGKIDKRDSNCNRFLMVLSYDGVGFHGWQKQTQAGRPLRTVESVLEDMLRPVLSQSLKFWPSGRTDAGVSALGQVAQFDAVVAPDVKDDLRILVASFNAALPPDVRCVSLAPTHKSFSANECLWKRYVYTIPGDAASVRSSCLHLCGVYGRDGSGGGEGAGASSVRVWTISGAGPPPEADCALDVDIGLDLQAMRRAAAQLVGTRDFASFQSKGGRSTTVRTLHRCDVLYTQADGLTFVLEGDGFLYNMVRIVAGTLVEIGLRRSGIEAEGVSAILEATDRARAGPTAPAAGLCLEHVEYDSVWAPSYWDEPPHGSASRPTPIHDDGV